MTGKHNLTAGFAMDLMKEGMVSVPVILLRSYAMLEISELELIVIIQILHLKQKNISPTPDVQRIASQMNISTSEVEACLNSLQEKNLLSKEIVKGDNSVEYETYSLLGLFDRLSEVWAQERIQPFKHNRSNTSQENELIGNLQTAFEGEFGRLLSPMEMAQITSWCIHDRFSPELINEALKISVLRGVLNFRYIDSILRDWKKNNVCSVKEARTREEEFQQRKSNKKNLLQTRKEKSETKKSDRFKNLYMN